MARMGRPPKSPDERKGAMIVLRTEDADKAAFERAAELSEMKLSDWIRERLRAAAKREIRKAESGGGRGS